MKIENSKIYVDNKEIDLYSREGFKILSDLWVKVGWDQKYMYGFTWFGRPIIQLPDDMVRYQEVIWTVKPTKIIETGIAHGGSLIYSASLLKLIGNPDSRVIGIDIDIRKHNLDAIRNHQFSGSIDLIEGSSVDVDTLNKVQSFISPDDVVMVVLDSCHDYVHVLKELELYSRLVTPGSFIVCTDGLQKHLDDSPRAIREYDQSHNWQTNNPYDAICDFVNSNDDFCISEPDFLFNESEIDFRVTHWPSAYIKRV